MSDILVNNNSLNGIISCFQAPRTALSYPQRLSCSAWCDKSADTPLRRTLPQTRCAPADYEAYGTSRQRRTRAWLGQGP